MQSRPYKARRALEHMQRLLKAATDPNDRERLRQKISGARSRLEKLEASHAKRAADPDYDWREEQRRAALSRDGYDLR